ncbi:MAG: DUF6268 family outer membrane beta-barrel protein [Bacteroidales bacterium]|nr:DUF6268 family outer membrane beta-barrel protein [Bacteroidales bacterium]
MCRIIVLVSLILTFLCLSAQKVAFVTEYYSDSDCRNTDGEDLGHGDMAKCLLTYQQPLSMEMTEWKAPRLWILSVRSLWAQMDNYGQAAELNPDKVINASANLTYLSPISEDWDLVVSGGLGIYAEPDHIRWSTVLFNGALVVVKKITPTFRIGAGGMLTNAYGGPALMPAIVFDWQTTGKYSASISMLNGMKAEGSMPLGSQGRLTLTAIEIDDISAVIKVDHKYKYYSSRILRSYVTPSWSPYKGLDLSFSIGVAETRSCRLSSRSLFSFYKHLFRKSDRFRPALRLSLGVSYSFR